MTNDNLTRMQKYKVQKYVNWYGVDYFFTRPKHDDLKQPVLDAKGDPVSEVVQTIRGVFHKTGQSFVLVTGDSGRIQNKPVPSILAMMDDSAANLQVGDWVHVQGNDYKITSVNDIASFGLFADISLELILNGLPV